MRIAQIYNTKDSIPKTKKEILNILFNKDQYLIINGKLHIKVSYSYESELWKQIPIQIDVAEHDFDIGDVPLINLVGSPKIVLGDFDVRDCVSLPSLYGGPEIVKGTYRASFTKITTLQYMPMNVGEEFTCLNTSIKDPKEYRYALYSEIGNDFYCNIDVIDEIINEYKGSVNRKHWAKAIAALSRIKL